MGGCVGAVVVSMRRAVVLVALAAAVVHARPTFPALIPNGAAAKVPGSGITCEFLGHVNCVPGAPRNQFGLDFKAAGLKWTKAFCEKDSDGDGVSNGEEMGDPCCTWKEGDGSDGLRTDMLSHPGDEGEDGASAADKCPTAPPGSAAAAATSTPATSTPATSTPAVMTPAAMTPAAMTPAAMTPAAMTPAAMTPAAMTPAAMTPAAMTPAAMTPAVMTPAASTPSAAVTPAMGPPAAMPSAMPAQMSNATSGAVPPPMANVTTGAMPGSAPNATSSAMQSPMTNVTSGAVAGAVSSAVPSTVTNATASTLPTPTTPADVSPDITPASTPDADVGGGDDGDTSASVLPDVTPSLMEEDTLEDDDDDTSTAVFPDVTPTLTTDTDGEDDDDDVCFPGSATVQLENGSVKSMASLSLGDRVLVGEEQFSDVFMFTHKVPGAVYSFVEIVADGGSKLAVTKGHFVYVNGALAPAGSVKPGDMLMLASGRAVGVTAVSNVKLPGLYNPQTIHGDIIVDGFRVSTYTTAVDAAMAHSVLSPLRAMYHAFGWTTTALHSGWDCLST